MRLKMKLKLQMMLQPELEPEPEPEPETELEAMSEEPDPLNRCDTKCRNVPHVGFVFMVKVELRLGRPIKAAHFICVCVCVCCGSSVNWFLNGA